MNTCVEMRKTRRGASVIWLHSLRRMAIGRRACTGGIHCDGIRGGTAGGALYVELQYEYSTQLRRLLIISEFDFDIFDFVFD